jgi:hypothetical protein
VPYLGPYAGGSTGPVSGLPNLAPDPPIPVEIQIKPEWCWAAVATTICNLRGTPMTQRAMVDSMADAGVSRLDHQESIVEALTRQGHCASVTATPLRTEIQFLVSMVVTDELAANRPPFAQAELIGAHHVVLIGAIGLNPAGDPAVVISDPSRAYRSKEVRVAELSAYRGSANWLLVGTTRP